MAKCTLSGELLIMSGKSGNQDKLRHLVWNLKARTQGVEDFRSGIYSFCIGIKLLAPDWHRSVPY